MNKIIEEKAKFIMENSGLLCTKLTDILEYENTINDLADILLTPNSLNEEFLQIKVIELLSTSEDFRYRFQNNYSNSLNIIFELCRYINKTIKNKSVRERILNIIREYPRKFRYDEKVNLNENCQFIKFDIDNYNEIHKSLVKTKNSKS